MRAMILVVVMAVMASAANAKAAQKPAPKADYAKAYAMAMRCVVYSKTYKDDASAKRAFDAAVRLGQLQGLSNRVMNDDFNAAVAREAVRLRQEASYPGKTRADCKALGWAT